MTVALVFNNREFRESLCEALDAHECVEYATAAAALFDISGKPFDLILLDAATYPGFGCSDGHINALAALIPKSQYNDTLLYWEVTLRLIDRARDDESPNTTTPICIRVSESLPSTIGMGDVLSKDAVRKDLKQRPGTCAIEARAPGEFARNALTFT